MGTLEATLESTVTTMARIESPLAELMCAWVSTADQSWPGAPVALNPATVMNMPAKNTSNEYDTCSHRCQLPSHLDFLITFTKTVALNANMREVHRSSIHKQERSILQLLQSSHGSGVVGNLIKTRSCI